MIGWRGIQANSFEAGEPVVNCGICTKVIPADTAIECAWCLRDICQDCMDENIQCSECYENHGPGPVDTGIE